MGTHLPSSSGIRFQTVTPSQRRKAARLSARSARRVLFILLIALFALVLASHRNGDLTEARISAPVIEPPRITEVGNVPGVVPGTSLRPNDAAKRR